MLVPDLCWAERFTLLTLARHANGESISNEQAVYETALDPLDVSFIMIKLYYRGLVHALPVDGNRHPCLITIPADPDLGLFITNRAP